MSTARPVANRNASMPSVLAAKTDPRSFLLLSLFISPSLILSRTTGRLLWLYPPEEKVGRQSPCYRKWCVHTDGFCHRLGTVNRHRSRCGLCFWIRGLRDRDRSSLRRFGSRRRGGFIVFAGRKTRSALDAFTFRLNTQGRTIFQPVNAAHLWQ